MVGGMEPKHLKIVGVVCLVVCAVCLFIAYERYQANAGNVQAMNQMMQSSPLGGMTRGAQLTPATPAATKYALLFAAVTGLGGAGTLVYASKASDSPGV